MTFKQGVFGTISVAAVVGFVVLVAGAAPDGPKPMSLEDEIRELKRRADDADAKYKAQQTKNDELQAELKAARGATADEENGRKDAVKGVSDALALTALNNPPVGSVVAYAGTWPPGGPPPGEKQWAERNGWALCNGASFDKGQYEHLYAALGGSQLPNYQGFFLRGLDPTGKNDPDRLAKKELYVGSPQNDAIGPHRHAVTVTGPISVKYLDWQVTRWGNPNNENDNKAGGGQGYKEAKFVEATASGNATLKGSAEITEGGGKDTRPKNVAVHFLIKTK